MIHPNDRKAEIDAEAAQNLAEVESEARIEAMAEVANDLGAEAWEHPAPFTHVYYLVQENEHDWTVRAFRWEDGHVLVEVDDAPKAGVLVAGGGLA